LPFLPPKKLLYLVHWPFFLFIHFLILFWLGWENSSKRKKLATSFFFFKKKYSFWLYSQKTGKKSLSICCAGFFFFSFLFLLGCLDAKILQEKNKIKWLYGFFFDFFLFNERFWFFLPPNCRKKVEFQIKKIKSQFICRKNDKFCVKITRMGSMVFFIKKR